MTVLMRSLLSLFRLSNRLLVRVLYELVYKNREYPDATITCIVAAHGSNMHPAMGEARCLLRGVGAIHSRNRVQLTSADWTVARK